MARNFTRILKHSEKTVFEQKIVFWIFVFCYMIFQI